MTRHHGSALAGTQSHGFYKGGPHASFPTLKPGQGRCPCCYKGVRVLKSGRLAKHRILGVECAGTGMRPTRTAA